MAWIDSEVVRARLAQLRDHYTDEVPAGVVTVEQVENILDELDDEQDGVSD